MARRSNSRSRSPSNKERHSHKHRSRNSSRDRRDNYFRSSDRSKKHSRIDRSETDSPGLRIGNSRRSATDSRRRRSRSRSPRRFERSYSPRRRRRSRSPSRDRFSKGGAVPKFLLQRPEITDKDLEGKTEEEQEVLKLMGFGGFDSTKGKHVPGNDVSAVHVIHKRKYRQYMNRKGGFNRPLDFVA